MPSSSTARNSALVPVYAVLRASPAPIALRKRRSGSPSNVYSSIAMRRRPVIRACSLGVVNSLRIRWPNRHQLGQPSVLREVGGWGDAGLAAGWFSFRRTGGQVVQPFGGPCTPTAMRTDEALWSTRRVVKKRRPSPNDLGSSMSANPSKFVHVAIATAAF